VDLYLKLMGVTKTRMAAKHLCDLGKVFLSSKPLKPSHLLAGGEVLEIHLPFKEIKLTVLQLPTGKSLSKQDRLQFGTLETLREF
jgi:ribosomal 50S subunit-recycling heat shock protein